MPSHTSRRARTFAGLALALASAAVLAGCASLDPVVLTDADAAPSATPTSNASEYSTIVADFVTENATLEDDYNNAMINMNYLRETYPSDCMNALYQKFIVFNDAFRVVANDVTTLQNQIAAGENVDPDMVKAVQDGLATATQNDNTIENDVRTECR